MTKVLMNMFLCGASILKSILGMNLNRHIHEHVLICVHQNVFLVIFDPDCLLRGARTANVRR